MPIRMFKITPVLLLILLCGAYGVCFGAPATPAPQADSAACDILSSQPDKEPVPWSKTQSSRPYSEVEKAGTRTPPDHDAQLYLDPATLRENYGSREEYSDDMYDSLLTRRYKNPITRWLVNTTIRGRVSDDSGTPSTSLSINRGYFEQFRGRKIIAVEVEQLNVFAPRDTTKEGKEAWGQRFINSLHVRTRDKQFTSNLMFAPGDTLNPYKMAVNEGYLRNLPFLSTAYFVVIPNPADSSQVVVHVFARDNWSISGDISIGGSQKHYDLFDRNFLGSGDELLFRFTSEGSLFGTPGFEVNYTWRNLFGSLSEAKIALGAGHKANVGAFAVNRPFILPSDWAWGLSAGKRRSLEAMTLSDTSYYIDRFELSSWLGKSWCLEWRKGTNIYSSISYDKIHYQSLDPPAYYDSFNPFYANTQTVLVNVGLSRKNYFQGNMIYGYGRMEDIPYGFRFEALGGYQWTDVGMHYGRYYAGVKAFWGDLTKIGFMGAALQGGTFFNSGNGALEQTVLSGEVRLFTPLLRLGSYHYLRQFVTLSAALGFNRLEGERERLRFTGQHSIRGLSSNTEMAGYNRLIASGETVLFSPIFLYHFRFAFFLFGDVGWIGNSYNLFGNTFTGSVGIGARIKNERLIFNNIQIRLGFCINRPPGVGYSNFAIESERSVHDFGLSPTRPEMVPYY